jgi:hypothetical protein
MPKRGEWMRVEIQASNDLRLLKSAIDMLTSVGADAEISNKHESFRLKGKHIIGH